MISSTGQQKLQAFVSSRGREALQTLVDKKDVGSLQQAAGLSKLDALALLDQATQKGFDAVFSLFGSTAVFGGGSNPTAGGQKAVSLAAGQRGAPPLSAMFAVKLSQVNPTSGSQRDVTADAAALTKELVARFDLDLFLPRESISAMRSTLADWLARDAGTSSPSERGALGQQLLSTAFAAANDPGLEREPWARDASAKVLAFTSGTADWTAPKTA